MKFLDRYAVEVVVGSFHNRSILESLASFISEDVAENRFILSQQSVKRASTDKTFSEEEREVLISALLEDSQWYVFNIGEKTE